MYSVYQHWDPLKVCAVGRSYPPEFYSWITIPHVRELFEKIAIETEEDYQNIIRKLQSFGVKVVRTDIPNDVNQCRNLAGTLIPPPMTPRDYTVMIGEKFGLAGCGLVMLFYAILIWSGLWTALRTQEPWGRLVAVGITVLLGSQVLLNTGMTVGLLPITGTALPLCSYGGSSLLSTYASVGLLINIRMHQTWDVAGQPFAVERA
jgi:hypothetical protein